MRDEGILAVMLLVAGFAFGAMIGICTTREVYRDEAIEHGYAEHDSKTGQWKWIEKGSEQCQATK